VKVAAGEINPEETHCWHEGLDSWVPLSQLLSAGNEQPGPPPFPPEFTLQDAPTGVSTKWIPANFTDPEVQRIAVQTAQPKYLSKIHSLLRKIPKSVWPILIASILFFILGFCDIDKNIEDTVVNRIQSGFICGFGGAFIVAYITTIVICAMKGKWWYASFGCFGFWWWPVIGALRLAKPNSFWARKYYGPEEIKVASERFSKAFRVV
jgi:hypothetical protein